MCGGLRTDNQSHQQRGFSDYALIYLLSVQIISAKYSRETWGKIDAQIQEYYKTLDQRGGIRQGSGRKVGTKNTTPKTERTERFTQAITKQEKEFLTQQLKEFRERNL